MDLKTIKRMLDADMQIKEIANAIGCTPEVLFGAIRAWRITGKLPPAKRTTLNPTYPELPESRPIPLELRHPTQCAVVLDSGLMCGAPITHPFRMCAGHGQRFLK